MGQSSRFGARTGSCTHQFEDDTIQAPSERSSQGNLVLIVEDDIQVTRVLRDALEVDGHRVIHAPTGEKALELLAGEERGITLVILDVGLPGIDGFQVLEEMEALDGEVPVLMLTAEDSEDAIVRGLSGGAQDYVVKPFSIRELRARVAAALRRVSHQSTGPGEVHAGLRFDLVDRTVAWEGKSVRLTSRELAVLWTLAQEPEKVFSREELLRQVWGIEFDPETSVFDVHLSRLRKKLATVGPITIETIRGQGYQLGSP